MAVVERKAYASLCNFEIHGPIQEIKLGDILIKKNPQERPEIDLDAVLKPDIDSVVYRWIASCIGLCEVLGKMGALPKYKMETAILDSELETGWSTCAWKRFEKVLAILRLFKNGRIGSRLVAETHRMEEGQPYDQQIVDYDCIEYKNDPYTLNKGEIQDLKSLYSELAPVSPKPHIDIAIRRFNDSYGRLDPVDRFIDYMIAFEALFSEGPGDLRYKISLRCATFLEDDQEKALRIYTILKRAYTDRNDVLHGKKDTLSVKENLPDIEEFLRHSIRKFLRLARDGKVLKPEDLDKYLFFSQNCEVTQRHT